MQKSLIKKGIVGNEYIVELSTDFTDLNPKHLIEEFLMECGLDVSKPYIRYRNAMQFKEVYYQTKELAVNAKESKAKVEVSEPKEVVEYVIEPEIPVVEQSEALDAINDVLDGNVELTEEEKAEFSEDEDLDVPPEETVELKPVVKKIKVVDQRRLSLKRK